MPINPTITTPIFDAVLAAHGDLGPSRSQLAAGLANGLFQYMQSSITTISIDAGTLGVGKGTGVGIALPVPQLISAMVMNFNGHGISGLMSLPNAEAVAVACAQAMSQATLIGFHPGVGAGAGKVQCIPSGSGGPVFSAAFKAAGMKGPQADNLASAVAFGLDAVMSSASGAIVIAGPPNIAPGAGVGIIKVQ